MYFMKKNLEDPHLAGRVGRDRRIRHIRLPFVVTKIVKKIEQYKK